MNSEQREAWQFEAIRHVLTALGTSLELRNALVFKGALVLDRRLGTSRVSLDIDANLDVAFASEHPDRMDQRAFLEENIGRAISRYFELQDPVRYRLEKLRIDLKPKPQHPLGWDAFSITVSLDDCQHVNVRGLPNVTIDVAAPESLSGDSVAELDLGGITVRAYTLVRIAGEKARAFLSTLPAYRAKTKKPGEAVRVKDLYDLTRIIRVRPITDVPFWTIAGQEFQLACQSRYVDCSGLGSFKEAWEETRARFHDSKIVPKNCTFEDIETTVTAIAAFWHERAVTPLGFPLPSGVLRPR